MKCRNKAAGKGRRLPLPVWLFITVAGILLILGILQILWLSGAFLPRWILWQERSGVLSQARPEETARAGEDSFRYELRGKRFFLYRNDEEIYASPREWCVQDVLTDDINGDGWEEIVMLTWRRGNYGKHMPTWVEKNDTSFSQHLFVYRLREETDTSADDAGSAEGTEAAPPLRALWMSSALGFDVRTMEPGGEIRGTGRPSILLTEPTGRQTRWGWLSWGFMLLEEMS